MKGKGQRRREERRLIMKSLRENIEMELFSSVGLIAVVQQECVVEDPVIEQVMSTSDPPVNMQSTVGSFRFFVI